MADHEVQRAFARAMLPRFFVLGLVCAGTWALAEWTHNFTNTPDSIALWIANVVVIVIIIVAKSGTILSAFFTPVLALLWLVNVLVAPPIDTRVTPNSDPSVLTFSWPWRLIAYLCFALTAFCIFFLFDPKEDRTSWIVMALFFGAAGTGAALTLNLNIIRILPQGIDFERALRPRHLLWEDITTADIDGEYLVLGVRDPRRERVSVHMRNVNTLLLELERRNVPPIKPS